MKLDLRQVCESLNSIPKFLNAIVVYASLIVPFFFFYQESARHSETLDAITKYLDMGVYSEWDEETKLKFLNRELKSKRPLVPPSIEVSVFSWNFID